MTIELFNIGIVAGDLESDLDPINVLIHRHWSPFMAFLFPATKHCKQVNVGKMHFQLM